MDHLKQKRVRVGLAIAGAFTAAALIGIGGYWLGANQDNAGVRQSTGEREVLYWYDPMVPDQHFDAPGRSPFMDMDLVPRYADEDGGQAGVRIDASVAQNLGVRLATVERAPLSRSVTAAGVIAFNDRQVAIVQARASGFVERSYGRAIGDVVAAGTPIVDIRVPEWTAAQAEYLALRSAGGDLAAAARRRLLMLGMPEALVARVERDGAPRPITTVTAPIAGAITQLDIRAGMTVMQGAPLASINGISPVWLVVSLAQADAGAVRPGARVVARTTAYPGERFAGRIESVLPAADPATRTVEVRIALANSDGRLRPGMTADAEIADSGSDAALIIPAEAAIQTGRRTVVIVADENGRYVPTEVELGRRAGNRIEVRQGLSEGQRVVASGQFLIDSEASLTGALERLQGAQAPQQSGDGSHQASGRVTAIGDNTITIAHGPVASIQWPGMTMAFQLQRPDMARGLRVGDEVRFRFREVEQGYLIEAIAKTETRR
ncbi:MAG: efflux RND transporter periplasmic adaptor subunit [Hydrogenophilaceae bacterium]|nr:efflux RND transporter periplasmic adaptor subunit [Hydrogenophilaceae bacterium]